MALDSSTSDQQFVSTEVERTSAAMMAARTQLAVSKPFRYFPSDEENICQYLPCGSNPAWCNLVNRACGPESRGGILHFRFKTGLCILLCLSAINGL